MLSGIVVNSVTGALFAHRIQGESPELIFGIMFVVMVVQVNMGFQPRPHTATRNFSIPASLGIGILSSLTGVTARFNSSFFWPGRDMRGATE